MVRRRQRPRADRARLLPIQRFWGNLEKFVTFRAWDDKTTGRALAAALAARKEPQVLLLWRKKTKAEDAFGHAVVVYDYRDGQFCIYDPNYPGEEVTLDWTLDGGFGVYYTPTFTDFWDEYVCDSDFLESMDDYPDLLDRAARGDWASATFHDVRISSPTGLCAFEKGESPITVTGRIRDRHGSHEPWNVIAFVADFTQAYHLSNVRDGTFELRDVPLYSGPNRIYLVATDRSLADLEYDRSWAFKAYSGSAEVTVLYDPEAIFKNPGFEVGNITGWTAETHQLDSGSTKPEAPLSASGSSALFHGSIVEEEEDPHFSTLSTVKAGDYAFRVGSHFSWGYASSIEQTATPRTDTASMRFYWAAVLETCNCSISNKPAIQVKVTDEDTGKTLYDVDLYSEDTEFTSWSTSGSWVTTGWQTVCLDLSDHVDHEIKVSVTTKHKAYVYLDSHNPGTDVSPPETMSTDERELAEDAFYYINVEREAVGLDEVSWSDLVTAVAYHHSLDMDERDFYAHENPSGDGPGDRLAHWGVGKTAYGECIWYVRNGLTPEQVIEGFMNSPGHKAIILTSYFTEVGVGLHEDGLGDAWWTLLFRLPP